MVFRVFQYPLPAPPELEDLNAWLSTHRVVVVTHHVAADAQNVDSRAAKEPGSSEGQTN